MPDKKHGSPNNLPIKKWVFFLVAAWTIVAALFATTSYYVVDRSIQAQIHAKAVEAFNKDQSFRFWATMHGGVYVPQTDKTPPNPYLTNVKERDITTPLGTHLTLMNPAYMIRQINEEFSTLYGVKGHITSLLPLRPENGPDEWEREGLVRLQQGAKEVYSLVMMDEEEHARFMRPMYTTKGCLKCHAHQGYEIGDVRGGVSIAIPMGHILADGHSHLLKACLFIFLLWFLGTSISVIGGKFLKNNLAAREAMAESLRQAKQEAETANHAKSIFLANMSHEIRTPLNGIIGMLQLFKTTHLNQEQSEYIEAASSSSERLTALLANILDLSMAETDVLELRDEPFRINGLFEQTDQLFKAISQKADVRLFFEADPNLPTLRGDPIRLQQIITNLVGNAVKFSTGGFVRVSATALTPLRENQCRMLFQVEDTGPGIPDSQLEDMFKPFSQMEKGYNRSYQGAGLGLSICKKLLDLMGGNLAMVSTPGAGTIVSFSINFEQAVEKAESKLQTEKVQESAALGFKILLAEDDRVSSMVAERLLSKLGCSVHSVENGQLALEALRSTQYDVALIDIQMPVMDGLEAIEAIRNGKAGEDRRDLKILALTAFVAPEDKERIMAAGADGVIAKPLDIAALIEALQNKS